MAADRGVRPWGSGRDSARRRGCGARRCCIAVGVADGQIIAYLGLLRQAFQGSERLLRSRCYANRAENSTRYSLYAQVDQAGPVATVTSQSVASREAALPPNMVCAFGNSFVIVPLRRTDPPGAGNSRVRSREFP